MQWLVLTYVLLSLLWMGVDGDVGGELQIEARRYQGMKVVGMKVFHEGAMGLSLILVQNCVKPGYVCMPYAMMTIYILPNHKQLHNTHQGSSNIHSFHIYT